MRFQYWLGFAATLLIAASANAMTAEELVAKNVVARGGMDKLQAIQSLRLSGKMIAGGNFELAMTQVQKRPDALRFEGTIQGMTMIQAYDGKEGWRVLPFFGRKDPERMTPDDLKQLALQADLDGPWVNATAKGNRIEYLGTEDIDGTDAHKLKVMLKNGDVEYVYFDPDFFLVIRTLERHTVRGVENETESDFSDYEQVDGVYLAFAIASGGVGETQRSKIAIDHAEANVAVETNLFAFPAAAGPAGK